MGKAIIASAEENLLEVARDYGLEVMKPIPRGEGGIPDPNSPQLERFDEALGRLVVASNDRASLSPDYGTESELRWVSFARWALKKSARQGEIPAGLDRTRLFSELGEDIQRELYDEAIKGLSILA